ncbi:Plasmid recombination enzyme [Loktanella atrilutea]|uniref:Plasmid recombination enzyme n=1 Tax=Loktanella atrilutea TaxID=366533 RepID=A0A1M5E1M8_LOKAT|nr:plasmid recombination protein [Loktanella atrilutea]SHF73076.1 Plasmid recombination enzyme [Loktanella atrilutea]
MPTTSTDQPFLVFNCEACGQEGVSAMDKHERLRISSASNIDPARRHLNPTLHGNPGGPAAALADLYASGVLQPAWQAHRPYLRIVMGASPAFFRPDELDKIGTWVPERLQTWLTVALAALRTRFGDGLVHVSLHLDEDTPHLHILVALTYWNKPRKIDRRRKGETDAAFNARKAAAEADPGKRTVGRASHPTLKLQGSIAALRAAFGSDFAPLGIHPGHPKGLDDPKPKTTRQWINEERVRLAKEWAALAAERAQVPRLKEAAVRAAFAQVHAHYQAKIAGLKKKVSDMMSAVTAWMRPLVALRNEAAAEAGLVARIRQAFKGKPDAEMCRFTFTGI